MTALTRAACILASARSHRWRHSPAPLAAFLRRPGPTIAVVIRPLTHHGEQGLPCHVPMPYQSVRLLRVGTTRTDQANPPRAGLRSPQHSPRRASQRITYGVALPTVTAYGDHAVYPELHLRTPIRPALHKDTTRDVQQLRPQS